MIPKSSEIWCVDRISIYYYLLSAVMLKYNNKNGNTIGSFTDQTTVRYLENYDYEHMTWTSSDKRTSYRLINLFWWPKILWSVDMFLHLFGQMNATVVKFVACEQESNVDYWI